MAPGSQRALVAIGCVVCIAWSSAAPTGALADRTRGKPAAAAGAEDDAEDAFASKVFTAGKAAYDIGNYDEALRYFQQAYELSGRAELLYYVGQAADHLGMEQTALKAFAMYLGQVPDAPNQPEVQQRLIELQEIIADKRDAAEAEAAAAAAAAQAMAPTAAEVALAAQPAPDSAAQTAESPRRDEASAPIWKRWWFWAGAGAVVVGVVVTAVVVAGGGEPSNVDSFEGSNGMVIQTLQRSGR
jgi:tetratricopeptide (TPR) repeat protein